MDAPVVNIEETYSTGRRSFLTGWVVTRWDGYHETQTSVPTHKGEPTDVIDDDARAEWEARNRDVYESQAWAASVWNIMAKTDWIVDDGDVHGMEYVNADGRVCTRIVRLKKGGILDGELSYGEFEKLYWANRPWRFTGKTFLSSATLTKHHRRAILSESRDDRLWELVFAWPESEWVARWGIFVDFLRDGEWGDKWARVGECLAESGWKPPHKLNDGLVSWWCSDPKSPRPPASSDPR